ncbi:MAG: hypothetical protein JEZ08_22380 [Clostridiales bacterium]|nr:hypothetical protein [Clostridiales bacterium]
MILIIIGLLLITACLIVILTSLFTSMLIDDSLDLLNYQDHYSTGVWAGIYAAYLYLSSFMTLNRIVLFNQRKKNVMKLRG